MSYASNGKANGGKSLIVWYGEYIPGITFTLDQLNSIPDSGPADAAVSELSMADGMKEQVATWTQPEMVSELRGYGAWDDVDLSDKDSNIQRMIWIAACDLKERHRQGDDNG